MGKLIKFEIHRLFHKKSFYVCMVTLLALIIMVLGMSKGLEVLIDKANESDSEYHSEENISADESDDEPGVTIELNDDVNNSASSLLMSTLWGSALGTILAVFIALFVCEDFSGGTLKNVLAKGFSRTKVFFAKWLVASLSAVLMSIVAMGFQFIIAYLFWGIGPGVSGWDITVLLVQILCIECHVALFFAIAVAIRSTGGAIAINIVGGSFIGTGLTLMNLLFEFVFDIEIEFDKYWIDAFIEKISVVDAASSDVVFALGCSLVYILAGLGLGLLAGRKKEV